MLHPQFSNQIDTSVNSYNNSHLFCHTLTIHRDYIPVVNTTDDTD